MDHLSSTILMGAILFLFYAPGTVKGIALDATCTTGGTACTDTNAECRDDGSGALKCLCKSTYYKSGTVCKLQVAINGACDIADMATDQCSTTNTACSDDGNGVKKCLCTSAYYDSSSTCTDRIKPAVACATDQCVTNAKCIDSKCACNTGYIATPTSTPTSCESSDAAIIFAPIYVFTFGIVASLYLLV